MCDDGVIITITQCVRRTRLESLRDNAMAWSRIRDVMIVKRRHREHYATTPHITAFFKKVKKRHFVVELEACT